jgi:hypothetical protein
MTYFAAQLLPFMPTGRAYQMAMLRKRYVDEWIVEPDIPGSREYARLAVIAGARRP